MFNANSCSIQLCKKTRKKALKREQLVVGNEFKKHTDLTFCASYMHPTESASVSEGRKKESGLCKQKRGIYHQVWKTVTFSKPTIAVQQQRLDRNFSRCHGEIV
jgi:hypothetical protein